MDTGLNTHDITQFLYSFNHLPGLRVRGEGRDNKVDKATIGKQKDRTKIRVRFKLKT